ncbi:MAG: sigma 54-interacting transcriptional regulator, partial [Deltaproteobacteria bacterium]|nr:sigma 54-interacting transcriptional regulator [Deltaproteobacteria bacterium]
EARAELARASSEARREVAAAELARVRAGRATRYPYDEIVGDSPRVRALLALLDRVVPTDVPVLVTGESGTGKELVARALHHHGPRANGPFVSENCAAIPEPLLESVLFGHLRGAFTGATHHRVGLFEAASGGTLFLDEIGEMPISMQAKLLRVLSTGRVRPVGGERERAVDVRIVTATHRDLRERVAAGAFRQDLLYRLDVLRLEVPALRERPEDIPVLVRHFLALHAAGRDVVPTPRALALLARFPFPGNVRQLENELRRALVLADRFVDAEHLSPEIRAASGEPLPEEAPLDLRARTAALELDLVRRALEECQGNQTRAARALGVSRFGLQKMIRRLGLSPGG